MDNTKIRIKRGNSYQKQRRDVRMKGTKKPKEHIETLLLCFDIHRGLSQSEEN